MSRKWHLRYAKQEELPELARVEVQAFAGNPIRAALLPERLRVKPGIEDAVDWNLSRYTAAWTKPGLHWIVVVEHNGDADEGPIVAWAQWMEPNNPSVGQSAEEGVSQFVEETGGLPPFVDVEKLGEFVKESAKTTALVESVMQREPLKDMWSLNSIAVGPGLQGQGIGSILLLWGMERARKEGKHVWLVASFKGRGFYLRHGFDDLGTVNILGGEQTVMLKKLLPNV